ncbi:MAG: PKD domain-containing protein [Ferruginibacter sp.]
MKTTSTYLKLSFIFLVFVLLGNNAFSQCHASFIPFQVPNTLTVNFTDSSTSPNTITSWHWDFGDGQISNDQNPHHTYTHDSTYHVCLIIHDNSGCSSDVCLNISVVSVPPVCHPAFTFHATQANPLTIEFADISTSGGTIISWHWEFGDGETSNDQNPHHTYTHDSTYHVCLTIHDNTGCSDHFCYDVTVVAAPPSCHPVFTFHATQANPLMVEFADVSTSGGTITSWHWEFGDGETSNDQNPHHTYSHDSTYNICLTIHDNTGCSDHFCHDVTVVGNPPISCHANFNFHQTQANPLTVEFTNTSTSPNTITSWLWDFGDGTISDTQNPHHTYTHDGTYHVCLTMHDSQGCTNQYCHDVTITTTVTCQAGFSFHIDSTGTVFFTNTSTGTTSNTTYSWNFGDGTTSNDENPHHTYSVPDHYTVCLFIHDQSTGCESHYCHTESYRQADPNQGPLVIMSYFVNNDGTEMRGLGQYIINYPNPSSSSTTIQYELTNDANVKLDILDRAGRRVMQEINENQSAGQHTKMINVNKLDPGVYFLKMVVAGQSFNKKIVVIR